MTERRRSAGRRAQDNVIQLIQEPYQQEIFNAIQYAFIHAQERTSVGFGYFFIDRGLLTHWRLHGLAEARPELSIGVLSKMTMALAQREVEP